MPSCMAMAAVACNPVLEFPSGSCSQIVQNCALAPTGITHCTDHRRDGWAQLDTHKYLQPPHPGPTSNVMSSCQQSPDLSPRPSSPGHAHSGRQPPTQSGACRSLQGAVQVAGGFCTSSRVFKSLKRAAASRIREKAMQKACSSRNRSCRPGKQQSRLVMKELQAQRVHACMPQAHSPAHGSTVMCAHLQVDRVVPDQALQEDAHQPHQPVLHRLVLRRH